jgi:hypothetical protein
MSDIVSVMFCHCTIWIVCDPYHSQWQGIATGIFYADYDYLLTGVYSNIIITHIDVFYVIGLVNNLVEKRGLSNYNNDAIKRIVLFFSSACSPSIGNSTRKQLPSHELITATCLIMYIQTVQLPLIQTT